MQMLNQTRRQLLWVASRLRQRKKKKQKIAKTNELV